MKKKLTAYMEDLVGSDLAVSLQGFKGESGLALARGAPGLPGTKGEPGERGYRGEKGAKGDAGSSGRLPRKSFYRGGKIGGKRRRISTGKKKDRVRFLIPREVSSHEGPRFLRTFGRASPLQYTRVKNPKITEIHVIFFRTILSSNS